MPTPSNKNRACALARHAAAQPHAIALTVADDAWSYLRLWELTRSYAAGLAGTGFARGMKLAIMMNPCAEFIAVEYAVFMLGGVVVPVNTNYTPGELEHLLQLCEIDFVAMDSTIVHRCPADPRSASATVKQVLVHGGVAGVPFAAVELQSLQRAPGHAPDLAAVGGDDIVLMLCTSATTGKAKGVMLSAGNLEANYDATPGWLGLRQDEVILCALPLYNTFAQNQVINATLLLGATMVVLDRFDVAKCVEAIQSRRCTFFPAVPTMLQKLLDDPASAGHDLGSLRTLCVGAAPVSATLLARLRRRIDRDARIYHAYGLTEATAVVTAIEVKADAAGELQNPKSIGKALPGVTVAVLGEDGRPAALGTVGEICIAGPSVMKGYYRAPAADAEAFVDGWLRTGDLAVADAQGFITIVDRKKDLIIRGGQNIYPAEIEEVLYTHPSVAEAVVVGMPDALLGEVPKAFVALKPACDASEAQLLAHCAGRIARFKLPVQVEIRPELPKGPTGKLLRRALRPGSPLALQ